MTSVEVTGPHLEVVGARLVWTGTRELPTTSVSCFDGQVVGLRNGTGGEAPPAGDEGSKDILDARGCIVTPGLVNAHHHLVQSAFRTIPQARHIPMVQWLKVMAAAYNRVVIDPELTAAAAAVGLSEALLCGVTTVADHHLIWPDNADAVAMALATVNVARDLGARLVLVRGSAGDDPETAAAGAEGLVGALGVGPKGITSDGMLQLAVGPAGVHSDGPETFRLFAEVADRYGLRRRTQANEQVDVEAANARYGRKPIDLLDDWGWLAPDVTVAHLCGISPGDADRLATSGASATHAPGCDIPSGWGVSPVGALLDRGVPVGLGTSGGGSNDAGHLLADARLAMQIAPLSPLPGRVVTARTALEMATIGSATGLGRPELGSLEVGHAADLCCWDVSGVADAGIVDPLAGLVWASPGRRPRHVVVGGRVLVRDGTLVSADEKSVVSDLHRLLMSRAAVLPPDGA
jgi:cytosine/adenosine deaminase-related metal-dependent hydrolase